MSLTTITILPVLTRNLGMVLDVSAGKLPDLQSVNFFANHTVPRKATANVLMCAKYANHLGLCSI